MSRTVHRLSARQIAAAKPAQGERILLPDGGNLLCQITRGKDDSINQSWIFRYEFRGERHDMGLGSLDTLGLAEARQRARKHRQQLLDNIDPLTERNAQKEATAAVLEQERKDRAHTFGAAADAWITKQLKDGTWGNPEYAALVEGNVRKRCQAIWQQPIRLIDEDDVIEVLRPIEDEGKIKTRGDMAIYLKAIIEFAEAQRWREHGRPNPARQEFLKHHFAKRRQQDIKRTKPMKIEEVPAFAGALRAKEGINFRALEFLMLTNVDPNNVLGAKWGEIEDGTWTTRKTKGRGELFEVPLSAHAQALLETLPAGTGNDLVFKGCGRNSLRDAMKEIRTDVKPKGLRPTFKTWATKAGFRHDVVETAMRHKVGGDIERLYDHNQWVAERRALMDAWAQYLDRPAGPAAVVPLRRA